jgi:hypothetical protein
VLRCQVAQGAPTAVTIASENEAVAARVQALLSSPRFRCYRTNDVQGAPQHSRHPAERGSCCAGRAGMCALACCAVETFLGSIRVLRG